MMKGRSVWIAGLAAAMIAMVLLSAGSPNGAANAQQAAPATVEVKIDNCLLYTSNA